MTHPDAIKAWRLLTCNWIVVGLMALALVIAVPLAGFSINLKTAWQPYCTAAAYIGFAYYNVWQAKVHKTKIIFILGSTGQILLVPVLMTPLTYIAASANLPMQDATLLMLDAKLGFDWRTYFDFIYHRHELLVASVLAYSMIGWPVFGIPILLGITGHYRRMQEFTLAFAIALIITTIISAFVPAIGTYDVLHVMPDPKIYTPGSYLEQLHDLPMVRDGTLRQLEYMKLTGIVTFPSFHAATAALYLWALWPVRWFRPIAVVVNIAMLLATPLGGGHYLVDIFAGIAVAAIGVLAACAIADRLIRPASLDTEPAPVSLQAAQ